MTDREDGQPGDSGSGRDPSGGEGSGTHGVLRKRIVAGALDKVDDRVHVMGGR